MLSESSFIELSIFRFGVRVFYCRVRVSQTRVRARVRVFPESGFSSDPSPSPVRVSKYAEPGEPFPILLETNITIEVKVDFNF